MIRVYLTRGAVLAAAALVLLPALGQGAPTADFIKDAKIEEISPPNLGANRSFSIKLKVITSAPLGEVQRDLTVLMNGDKIGGTDGPPDAPVAQSAASPTAPEPRTLLLAVRTPSRLPSPPLHITVMSHRDGRVIAEAWVKDLDLTLLERFENLDKAIQGLMTLLLAVLLMAITRLLWRSWKRRQVLPPAPTGIIGIGPASNDGDIDTSTPTTITAGQTTSTTMVTLPVPPAPPEPPALSPISAIDRQAGLKEIPAYMIEAAARGSIAVVLGAGASGHAGLKVGPGLWLSVIDRVLQAESLDAPRVELLQSLRAEVERKGAGEIIDAIVGVIGRDQVTQALAHSFEQSQIQQNPLHRSITSMQCKAIIDMTWDDSAHKLLPKYRVFTPKASDGIVSALRSQEPMMLKPLGYLNDGEWLSLRNQEMRRMLGRTPDFERAMAGICSSHNLLFIGMSLSAVESFLKCLPANVEAGSRNNVVLLPESEASGIWKAGTGADFGVEQVVFPLAPNYQALRLLVAQLANAAYSAPRRNRSDRQERLTRVILENIGVFTELTLDLDPKWTVLLGTNGGGKSTILKAIAVALAGDDPRAAKQGQRLLRTGASSGSITLFFSEGTQVKTTFGRSAASVSTSAPYSPLQAGSMVVLGFPVLRGVSLRSPQGAQALEAPDPSVDDIAMLAEGTVDTRLDDLKQWVVNCLVGQAVDKQSRDSRMLETVRRLIKDMMPGGAELSRVDPDAGYAILVKTPDGEVELDSLSQGMSSIFNWVGVLTRRLYDLYPNSPDPEKEFALVLIDEIDAHLHPQWQRRIIDIVKAQFENIQVVATTHSPLLAGAVVREQLRVVRREDGRVQVSIPAQDLSGQRADDILTSDLFDMKTSRSPDAERTICHFLELFEKPPESLAPEEALRLRELQHRMSKLNYGSSRPSWAVVDEEPKLATTLSWIDAIDDDQIAVLKDRLARAAAATSEDKL